MPTLKQDISTQAEWLIKAFATENLKLDYSIHSFIEIDKFFHKHSKAGEAIKGGRLSRNLGAILFSAGAYVGQTIIKNVPDTVWQTDDNDPEGEINASLILPDGTTMWPMMKVIKRFKNGSEDSIYPYGHYATQNYINEPFDEDFWKITSAPIEIVKKPWWKFW